MVGIVAVAVQGIHLFVCFFVGMERRLSVWISAQIMPVYKLKENYQPYTSVYSIIGDGFAARLARALMIKN